MESYRSRSFTERMAGAARLDTAVYEELEADRGATSQAALVVGIVAIAAAIGGAGAGAAGLAAGLISAYLGWLLWSAVTYVVGDKLLGGTATWGELLRTIGFAQTPGILYVLAILPLLGWLVRFVVSIWILIAVITAMRTALDIGTGRTIVTAIIGWVVYVILGAIVLAILGVQPQLT